jgi:hypothetical protein
MRSAPTLKIWMTPWASVAMLEKLALLRIARCRAPALSSTSSACLTSVVSASNFWSSSRFELLSRRLRARSAESQSSTRPYDFLPAIWLATVLYCSLWTVCCGYVLTQGFAPSVMGRAFGAVTCCAGRWMASCAGCGLWRRGLLCRLREPARWLACPSPACLWPGPVRT